MELEPGTLGVRLVLAAAAFGAGVVDAVIGGGGMLQIPALFAFLPGIAPPPLLGTNKLASAIGTTGAAIQYSRSVDTPWRIVLPCVAVGLGFSFLTAAAPAKFTNVASNVGAVVAFAATGYIFWALGLFMAAANFLGGQVGARLALRYGNDFIRRAFYILVSLLIAKTLKDAYL